MKDRRLWLAVVSALIATQHHTGEAAVVADTDTGRENSVRGHASVAEEETVAALFDDCRYEQVIETADAAWPRLDAMPERVLYCVAESSIRAGRVQAAKNGFELLIARNPQKQSYRAGLAYTLLYGGELARGLSLYHQVLAENKGLLAGAAEDAVALLSQGNIGGGKALFKMVIELSPDKQYYRQLYQKSLRMYRIADDSSVSPGTDSPSAEPPAITAQDEQEILHTQAVAMAQNGQFEQSLAVMNRLFKADTQNLSIASDYIMILQQAGHNDQAVKLFEQYTGIAMPFAVIKSVSTAYFELKEYDKAMGVLQPAIMRGERDALLWAGEMYLRRGNPKDAQLYYEWLLSRNPNDYEVYLSRGMLGMETKDYRQAAGDLERVRRLMPDSPDRATRLLNVEYKLAVAYMQLGQDQKAASMLANYTKILPVEDSLASAYVTALANSSQYELAVREGERLWPTYKEGPLPGLRSLAESYIRLGRQDKALAVYRQLAEQQPGDDSSLRMLAFQLMLNGRTVEGLALYDKLLSKAAVHADEAAADAETFINTDQYIAGKTLFELLLKKYPKSVVYRRQYAEVLAKKKLNRAAYQQYQLLAGQAEGELAGLSGMARTALALGDYPKSRKALDTISGKYGRSKAVAALDPGSDDRNVDNGTKIAAVQDNSPGMEPSVLSPAKLQEIFVPAVSPLQPADVPSKFSGTKEPTVSVKEEFAYEMAQIATKFLAAPVTNPETFKVEFAYAISTITAKVMPLLPSEQRNEFAYEMSQITSTIINEQNLDIKQAKADFAQLTTKVINYIDSMISGEKPAALQKNDSTEPKTHDPSQLDMDTYTGLIDDLMEVGHSSKPANSKVNIDGELRYHYAANSGAERFSKDVTGLRLYLSADSKINKDWHVYGMLEGQKSIANYNNMFELSRFYVTGKVGTTTVKAGAFGYLMAEGNIYDSRFDGVRLDFGDTVKYTLSYGKTDNSKATFIATARYNDFDYNLESGLYHYQLDDGSNKQNTIWNISGTYNFSNFSLGAMYLNSSRKDGNGDNNGYVLSFNYGDQRDSRPGTYNLFAKYYNQASGTYIDHGMNGQGSSMEGVKGYGVGMYYTLAKNLVMGVEYYNLTDKVSGEKGKTLWSQVTHYF